MKRKQKTGEMAEHVSDLRNRMSSIPPTPGVKRLKVTSSNYRDYLSPRDSMKRDFSYVPKTKLPPSFPLSFPGPSSYDDSAPLQRESEREDIVERDSEEDNVSFYDPDLFTMYDDFSDDDFSPPPLPPSLPKLSPPKIQVQLEPVPFSRQPMPSTWQPVSPPWQPDVTPLDYDANMKVSYSWSNVNGFILLTVYVLG